MMTTSPSGFSRKSAGSGKGWSVSRMLRGSAGPEEEKDSASPAFAQLCAPCEAAVAGERSKMRVPSSPKPSQARLAQHRSVAATHCPVRHEHGTRVHNQVAGRHS